MKEQSVPIEIVQITPENVAVKLPFVNIPVTMNHDFFKRRIENGYFRLRPEDISKKIRSELLE